MRQAIEVVQVATVREVDGLALSSRNLRLSEEQRSLAPELYKVIKSEMTDNEAAETLESIGFNVDYVQTKKGRRFAAASLGSVRLIDNVEL